MSHLDIDTQDAPNHPSEQDINKALRLEVWTIRCLFVVAIVSFWLGISSERFLLITLSAYSVTALISAIVIYRQLTHHQKRENFYKQHRNLRERNSQIITGCILYALSAYIVIQAVYVFLSEHHSEIPLLGIVIAYLASVVMPFLAKEKREIAKKVGSRALHASAVESFTYGYLALMVLLGLSSSTVHGWWIDTIGSLLIVPLIMREAHKVLRK